LSRTKKIMYYAVFLIVLCIGCSLYYFNQYHINNDNVSIQSNLKDWLNKTSTEEIIPNVLDVVRLDNSNSYIALFQLENNNIGYSQLIKGSNGKLKIERAGYGTNVVSYEKIETNKGVYGILVGKNPDLKMDHLSVKLKHEEFGFTTDVSKDEKFVKYEKLPSGLKETFQAELTLFDENNTVIQ